METSQRITTGIWNRRVTVEELNAAGKNTLSETMQIVFTDIGSDYLTAKMPVSPASRRPGGFLHGGASAALAETVGSMASWLCAAPADLCVGMEINCNHIKGKTDGTVSATARPLHLGKRTHVWDIRLRDEEENLIAASRLTVAILENKASPVSEQH